MAQDLLPNPSRDLDAALHRVFVGYAVTLASGPISNGRPVPAYTSSIDAAVALCESALPGWIWRLCQCSVSDDAWLMPDMNHPDFGESFQVLWPDIKYALEEGPGIDISTTPSGRPAMALMTAFLQVARGLIDGTKPPCPDLYRDFEISNFLDTWETDVWPKAKHGPIILTEVTPKERKPCNQPEP